MTKKIQFELVSPEEKLVSEPVHMAVIPAHEGEMGVGADHAAFVVALEAGVVRLYSEAGKVSRRIFIAGGFADVTGELCSVLAEQAVNLSELDSVTLEGDLVRLGDELSKAEDSAQTRSIQAKIALTEQKIRAVKFA